MKRDPEPSNKEAFADLVADWGLDEPVTGATALVASGLLDSLALFRLALWAEDQTGLQLDPTAFDPAIEWATVGNFLAFVEKLRGAGAPRRLHALDARANFGGRDCVVVRYEAAMKPVVAAFQRGLWSPDQAANERYLEWKYERNPYAAGSQIYLAFCGEALVGMRGFYGSLWEAGTPAEKLPVLVADDLLIREDFRGTGLFNHLMQYAIDDLAEQGHEWVLNVGANRVNLAGSLATGWQAKKTLRPLSRVSRARDLRKGLRRAVARLPMLWRWSDSKWLYGRSEREPFAGLDECRDRKRRSNGIRVESQRDAPIDEMARLVAMLPHDGRIRHVRDDEYLRWRFALPFAVYRFVLARDAAGRLRGYAVLRSSPALGQVAVTISDLEATDDETTGALLDHIVRHGRLAEVVVWGESLPGGSEALFRRHGFVEVHRTAAEDSGDTILVKFTAGAPAATSSRMRLVDGSDWDIRMLYTMRG